MSSRDLSTVGRRLAAARGLASQADLAAQLGINPKTIQRWEADEALPDGSSLIRLWKALGLSPQWVLVGDSQAPPLAEDETRLLLRYRNAPDTLRQAVLRALETGRVESRVTQTFHAGVGQIVQGDAHVSTLNVGSERPPRGKR